MFRKWLSGFIGKNKDKMKLVLKIVLVAAFVLYVFYFILSGSKNMSNNIDDGQTVYKPQETVISGSDLNEEKYKEDSNIVDVFVGYCNEGKVNEAYELLTDECKQNLYPKLEDFKQKYCDRYFATKKEYALQSWVKKGDTTTYQMRIMEDMLSSGKYQSGGTYQDYITIVENDNKVNINGYIGRREINRNSNVEGLDINVIKVDVYMDYEEYTIKVTNNTENVIMLDSMKNPTYTLRLLGNDNNNYSVRTNSISYTELMVNPEEEREMKIQFNKKYTSDSGIKNILFSQVVKNYNEFIQNQAEYNDFTTVKVEL